MSEMIEFDLTSSKTLEKSLVGERSLLGLILNLEEEAVKAIILGDAARVTEGMRVRSTGKVLSIPVGEGLLGRVVSPLIFAPNMGFI